MYGSWYMEHDWENFFVILDYFLPFYPTNNPKNRNFEKMKKPPGDIIILHKCTKNNDHILYCSWDMARDRCNLFFFLGYFVALIPPPLPNSPKNQNFSKNEKNLWRYHHFTHVHQKLWSDNVHFLKYGVWWTDGKSDI